MKQRSAKRSTASGLRHGDGRPRAVIAAAMFACAASCAELAGVSDYNVVAPKPITKETWFSEWVRVICEGIAPCCNRAGIIYDVEACKALTAADFEYRWFQNAVPDRLADTSYDAQAASDCVALSERMAASCGQGITEVLETCTNVWVGSRLPGSPCEHAVQCSHSFGGFTTCDALVDGEPTVCIDQPRSRSGAPCSQTCSEESNGIHCFVEKEGPPLGYPSPSGMCFTNDRLHCNASGTCRSLLFTGSSCSTVAVFKEESECERDAYCDGTFCRPRGTAGSLCLNHLACDDASYCNDAGVCAGKLSQGSPCNVDDECVGFCLGNRGGAPVPGRPPRPDGGVNIGGTSGFGGVSGFGGSVGYGASGGGGFGASNGFGGSSSGTSSSYPAGTTASATTPEGRCVDMSLALRDWCSPGS